MENHSISYHSKISKTIKLYRETFGFGSHLDLAHYFRPVAMECVMAGACRRAKPCIKWPKGVGEEFVRSHSLLPIR